jgi:putative phosphoesterase
MIGLMSDVHGNLPALEAVLDDMPEVDSVVNAGDVVGYNPFPSDCVEAVRDHDMVTVQGNHDRAVAGETSFAFHSDAGRAVEWTRERLDDDELEWLGDLPTERETVIEGMRVKTVHGEPGDPNRYVYPHDFSESLLGGEDALVLGHTHVQVKRKYDEGLIVNPGSVGQPRDGDPRAAYAVLEAGDGEEDVDVEVDLRRVEYPVSETQEEIRSAGLPEPLAERLADGR